MAVFKLRLVRPTKHVVLELTEGLPLMKGTWRRLVPGSNSSLQANSGEWENWVLGSPGGGQNIRLYDGSATKSAVLKNYTTGAISGKAEIILPGFGGEFGDDDFDWFVL